MPTFRDLSSFLALLVKKKILIIIIIDDINTTEYGRSDTLAEPCQSDTH